MAPISIFSPYYLHSEKPLNPSIHCSPQPPACLVSSPIPLCSLSPLQCHKASVWKLPRAPTHPTISVPCLCSHQAAAPSWLPVVFPKAWTCRLMKIPPILGKTFQTLPAAFSSTATTVSMPRDYWSLKCLFPVTTSRLKMA